MHGKEICGGIAVDRVVGRVVVMGADEYRMRMRGERLMLIRGMRV